MNDDGGCCWFVVGLLGWLLSALREEEKNKERKKGKRRGTRGLCVRTKGKTKRE